MPHPLPPNTKIILLRRGKRMRITLPVDSVALFDITPPELAIMAMGEFMKLQMTKPGLADMPVLPTKQRMGLTLPSSDFVLDPEVNIGKQLMGRWEEQSVQMMNPETGAVEDMTLPCVALNLDDIHER